MWDERERERELFLTIPEVWMNSERKDVLLVGVKKQEKGWQDQKNGIV